MDLVVNLRPHYTSGSQIVMSMDTNERDFNSLHNAIESAFKEFGMADICFHNHGRENAPATTNTGSKPIDTLMVTRTLRDNKCGYLPFDDLSNHRGIWADFPTRQVFGASGTQSFVSPKARRLQCKDPRVLKKYNMEFKKLANSHGLIARTFKLESTVQGPLTPGQKRDFEELDKVHRKISLQAEKKCRRLKMGNVSWTPEYRLALMKHRFWILVLKRLQGCKVGRKYLK